MKLLTSNVSVHITLKIPHEKVKQLAIYIMIFFFHVKA